MTLLDEAQRLDEMADEPTAAVADVDTVPEDQIDEDAPPTFAELIRPVLAAGLASSAVGLVAGGIFGSWSARLTGAAGAVLGAAYVLGALRSKRAGLITGLFPVALAAFAAASLVLRGEAPGDAGSLVADALDAGRLFRPPVPFDAGWTPLLLVLMGLVGFGTAWVATAMNSPKAAVAIPLPLVALLAITQPEDGQFLAGVLGLIPVLAGVSVIFGGDASVTSELSNEFEAKRAVRSIVAVVPIVALLFAFSSADFLFPDPVFDPDDQPQKPRAVPLSASNDRVLFEVATDANLTGPWRIGVLDVYDPDDGFWKSSARDLGPLDAGTVSDIRAEESSLQVTFTIRDLGNGDSFPMAAGTTVLEFPAGSPDRLRVDRQTGVVRVSSGRVPTDVTYTARLPRYPSAEELEQAGPPRGDFAGQLEIDGPPPAVEALLASAPQDPWLRLDFLRNELLANVVASGAGTPVEVSAERVGEMFEEDAEATPYEIVAAEAMLGRWAGVPSRIGFGFDGLNAEDALLTVRPKNSAQWLEVNFAGYGWVPLIGAPKQAEASLDNDPNARFNPTIEASSDVAVRLYLAFEIEPRNELYQRVRGYLTIYAPFLVLAGAAWLFYPFAAKIRRGAKRRAWAAETSMRNQVAIEYAEFRDLATDLNVADIYSTPLEYLFETVEDDEHAEFAWLVARCVYGDMRDSLTDHDVQRARELGESMRRRLRAGQPFSAQAAALFSRASLRQPYTAEVPNVKLLPSVRVLPRLALPRPSNLSRRLRPRLLTRGAS